MPGVLPLKTIQLNTSSQSRIAQACDRCRSKKIRCDGIQPNCTPCQAVNFECKTSDKLSRKAYPKGYTSSLEERVRELESEVRDLKNLLDEKDEKIDILSKMRHPSVAPSAVPTPPASTPSDHGREELFKVQQTPCLYGKGDCGDIYMGASSGRPFVELFKAKLQEDRKCAVPFDALDLFKANTLPPKQDDSPAPPPRVVSDQLINIFFQEWASMFPVLHRPTFLKTYQDFLTNPRLRDAQSHAQMYLVFGIATLASSNDTSLVQMYEAQWRKALSAVLFDTSIETLQCLVLASLYSIVKGDYRRLLHFLGLAVSMSSLLGLQQSQKQFSHGALTRETRKKVFWSLYTIDCFASTSLGVSRLIKDADIHTEDPCDVDDENVSERGFQATLPGENTKISSALALFKAAKVLSKVLDELYPNASSYDLSLSKVAYLNDELIAWRDALPAHLRLEFIQDKLNVNVTSDRSPLLALVYFHIRSCIHRPVVTADIGDKGMASVLALAESSKRIAQLAKLLEQRSMSFTLCINRNELLALAGIGLLSQAMDLRADSRICRENGKVIFNIAELISCNSNSASITLKKVAIALFGKDAIALPPTRRSSQEGSMSPPKIPERKESPKAQIQAIASRLSSSNSRQFKKSPNHSARRTTLHSPQVPTNLAVYSRSGSQVSSMSSRSPPTEPVRRTSSGSNTSVPLRSTPTPTNLDYLPIDPDAIDLNAELPFPHVKSNAATEWDPLLNGYQSFDSNSTPPMNMNADYLGLMNYQGLSTPPLSAPLDLSPEAWNAFDPLAHNGLHHSQSTTAHSVLSMSDESLTSGEELSSCDFGVDVFPGYSMPAEENFSHGFDEYAAMERLGA